MNTIKDFVKRHEKICFFFSGGKDSTACLYLLEPFWDKIDVVFLDSGNMFPEFRPWLDSIMEKLPNVHILHSDSFKWGEENGWPVDILPCESTPIGKNITKTEGSPKLVLQWDCCNANIWKPTMEFFYSRGYTGLIRGNKSTDIWVSSIRSGDIIEGIEVLHPIENWTTPEVFKYLKDKVPPSYRYFDNSGDCMHCTAFLNEGGGRLPYLREKHPEVAKHVESILHFVYFHSQNHMRSLERFHG